MCAGGFHCTRLSLTFLNILYLAFSITIIAVACWARNVGMIISPPIIGGKNCNPMKLLLSHEIITIFRNTRVGGLSTFYFTLGNRCHSEAPPGKIQPKIQPKNHKNSF